MVAADGASHRFSIISLLMRTVAVAQLRTVGFFCETSYACFYNLWMRDGILRTSARPPNFITSALRKFETNSEDQRWMNNQLSQRLNLVLLLG